MLRNRAYLAAGLFFLSMAGFQLGCSETEFTGVRITGNTEEKVTGEDAIAASSDGSAPRGSDSLDEVRKPDTLIQSFESSVTKTENFAFSLAPRLVSMNFALEDVTATQKDNFTQVVRTPVTDSDQQGTPGTAITETFAQEAKKGLVDILVIIDDSASMKEEQTNLSSKLGALLVAIQDANWQISVITTSPKVPEGVNPNSPNSEGRELCQSTLIRAGDADASAKFSQAVQAGLAGSGNEQGVRQAVVGLRCTERPWLRSDATLAVLIVSDEDNCSNGSACGALPWSKESYLIQYVENTLGRTIGTNAGIYGIIGPSKALCPSAVHAGTQYIQLFQYKAPQGVLNYGNICDANYTGVLNRISNSIALLLKQQFELRAVPDPNSLKLTLNLQGGTSVPVEPSRFQLMGKVVSFVKGQEPPLGSTVVAQYVAGAKPMRKSFSLKENPAPGTLSVKINGAVQAANTYSLSGRTVTFNQEPPALANLAFDYRVATPPLRSRFKPTMEGLPGTFMVKVDGKNTTAFVYDTSKKEIEFTTIPADGQAVEVSYTRRVGPRLSYTLPIATDAQDVRIVDAQETPIAFTRQGGVFTINQAVHAVGKVLQLRYDVPDGSTKTFELGKTVIGGSAVLTSSKQSCTLGQGFQVEGSRLISTCVANEQVEFTMSYQHEELQRSYVFVGVVDPEKGRWQVFVDDVASEDFVREGTRFTLSYDPPAKTKIEIHYTPPE